MLTIADPIRHAARTAADRTALVCGDEVVRYRTLHERCRRLAGALAALGLQRGDRVAVLGLNCHRYVEVHLAVPAAGYVVVPLNTRLAEAELRAIVGRARPRVLLTDRPAAQVRGLAAEVEHVVEWPGAYEELLAGTDPSGRGELGAGGREDDLAAIFFTGGTTGTPKGVMLTHRNLVANAFHKAMACRFSRDDVLLAIGPLFHVAGTAPILSLAWLGATVVVQPTFDPARALDLVERHGVTATLPVPTMLAAVLDEQRSRCRDLSSLRLVGHAGAPIAADTLRRARAVLPHVELAQFYGATETAPIVTCLPHEERELDGPRAGSCGQPVPGVEVQVVRTDGAPAGAGVVGEVWVRGPNVTAGYWEDPDATAAALVDGWYRTGDLGHQDADGYLFLVDRLKDMIVTGGENVYSVEVEDVLAAHPGVQEAAVFGIPDPRWGEAVHALVVARPGVDVDALGAELDRHCRAAIAGFKVPKRVEVRTEPLPRSGPGKILKRALRAPYWEGHDVTIV
jgi:long-chain acyl-CoA synthetase